MRFKYSTTDPSQDEFDSLPRLPLVLRSHSQSVEVVGLIDSAATVNVFPYEVGIRLGATWDDRKANIRLAGSLGSLDAMPLFVTAQVGDFAPVRLAFAWVKTNNVPLILGQTNFFVEFDVCFYRSQLEFEVKPKSS
ncbi:hypothetical protein HKBW3S42_00757 [Candidatus Hakubella thermalkaliphila]|uniref:Retroviral aspartyl protease n=1 Tax=Candidatus Hakubella thermalkaliphila TaxID=2754717 RepID=A0A6V8PJJ5_9ACTN|nr:hypothetical protein HKBW3S25_01233 [Candidatus Hakubella thermalkaliphila]GFP32453.1 hypothetical protein HKBW3S42_00757 [Candidatus Hakubella thermalkaliphila]